MTNRLHKLFLPCRSQNCTNTNIEKSGKQAFKGWLKPFIGDDTQAYCHYCKVDFCAINYVLQAMSCTRPYIKSYKSPLDGDEIRGNNVL